MEAVDYIAARAGKADDAAFEEVLRHIQSTPITEDWDKMPD